MKNQDSMSYGKSCFPNPFPLWEKHKHAFLLSYGTPDLYQNSIMLN